MRQRQTQDNVIGLTLQLQKFSVGTSPMERYQSKNTVLGHYDDLMISKITRWLDFSPRMDWENSRKQNTRNAAVTHYPLKLLFPDWGNGEPAGFAYEAWKAPEILLKSNPCMTIVLLNLTDAYKRQIRGNLLNDFLRLLTEEYEPEPPLDKMHCCVLPSIGYSDFCILMAGTDWRPAFKLVECLHNLTSGDTDRGKTAVLSTDYMIPVFHRGQKKVSSRRFKGLELSVRVNLSPGTTAQQLADHLPEVQVYRSSGGADCVLWAKKGQSQQQLIDFLLDSEMGNLVIDMASTPHLLLPHSEESPGAGSEKQDSGRKGFIDLFEKAVTAYETGLIENRRHCRQANSLRELAIAIGSVCAQSHTGDLHDIMEGLLGNFSYCLEELADRMSQDGWNFDEMETHVSLFTDIVNRFLSDLSRSDCFFMEREKYSHASVSSATSLLIAYNQWLNSFSRAISEATEKCNQSNFAFLVTSGGRDQTQTLNAFYFLEPSVHGDMLYERKPLVTQMSEMSLFDFSGSILRSAHECMHFSGGRRRRDRVKFMLTFVNTFLAQLFASALLPDDRVYQYARKRLEELNAEPVLLDDVKTAYKKCWIDLAEIILTKLNACFDLSAADSRNESDLLCKNVREWIYETLMRAFSGYEMLDEGDGNKRFVTNELAHQLYLLTQWVQRQFFEQCDQLCEKYKVSTVLFAFGAKRQEIIEEEDRCAGRETDEVLSKQVQIILSRLLITSSPKNMPVFMEKSASTQSDETADEEADRVDWERKFPYFSLTYSNLNSLLRNTEDIFSESFADITACESLGAVLEDYLLMHVYEEWNLESALKKDMTTYYRIPVVLRICFPGDLCDNGKRLTMEARKRMDEAVRRLVGHGMPNGRLNAGELCDRIDELLLLFAENEDIAKPLIDYLRLCQDDYTQAAVKDKLKPFYDSFHTIRLLSIDPQEKSVHEQLLAMYNALIDRGGEYHNNAAKLS